MKKLILTFMVLAVVGFSNAQTTSGKITYKATVDLEAFVTLIKNDTAMPEKRKESRLKRASAAVPTNFHLFFNDNESLYKAEHDMNTLRRLGLLLNQTGNVGKQSRIYYTNLQTKEKFYQYFFTKEMLVSVDEIKWKLTQETKKIGKYTCYKAIAEINTEQAKDMNLLSSVIAWYTPQIPVPFGIQSFVGLPGLTLELIADYNKGKIYYKATKIELNPKEEIRIKRPKGRKQISEKEYIALRRRNRN